MFLSDRRVAQQLESEVNAGDSYTTKHLIHYPLLKTDVTDFVSV